jgi:hypothetical protein
LRDVVNSANPFENPASALSNGFAKMAAVSYPRSRNCSGSHGLSYTNPRSLQETRHQFAPVSTAKCDGTVQEAGAYALVKFIAPAANRARCGIAGGEVSSASSARVVSRKIKRTLR